MSIRDDGPLHLTVLTAEGNPLTVAESLTAPLADTKPDPRREILDALIVAAEHGAIPNGTTGAMDLLARYDAWVWSERVGP